MSPFVLFRVWLRRAPLASRVSAASLVVVVIGLLAWVAVPAGNPPSQVATIPGAGGTRPGAGPSAVGSSSGGSPGTTATGSAAGASATPGGRGTSGPIGGSSSEGPAPSGPTAAGSTSPGGGGGVGSCSGGLSPMKIGVVIPDVGSGSASLNATFGIPSASEEQSDFAAAFDSVNKAGGVACHSLVGDYAVFNETDSTAAQTECLQFAQDQVFAVLGGWLPSSSDTCALTNHLPTIEQEIIPGSQINQFYPYYLSDAGELDLVFHNFAHAVAQEGYLSPSKGFKKVGIFYRDCIAGEYQTMVSQLEQVGVPSSAITSYDVGCSSSPFAPPSTVESAILNFQRSGVTDVIPMNEYEDIQAFSRQAQTQGYKPQYLIADDGIVATSSSPTFSPYPSNFNGAAAITAYQYGAESSGLPESSQTKLCDQIMTSHGLPTVYKSGDAYAGVVCSLVWMLQAGIQHDQGLSRSGLAPALAAAGSVALSYPNGPTDFKASRGTYGGEFWRPLQFQAGCTCWKVTNQAFAPSFP